MYKKILVPLDSSKLSELSLEHVKKVAITTRQSEVILLIVLESVSNLTYSYSGLPEKEMLKLEKKRRDHAQNYINKLADRLNKGGIRAQGEVACGSPAEVILQYIDENGIDLVVMSTHGRSGFSRWALGSVADKVIRSSTVPVLVISPQELKDNKPVVSRKASHTSASGKEKNVANTSGRKKAGKSLK